MFEGSDLTLTCIGPIMNAGLISDSFKGYKIQAGYEPRTPRLATWALFQPCYNCTLSS